MQNNSAKNKVKEKCAKSIRTTMIGAIDIIEKEFAEELKVDEDFQKAFYSMREKILDLGNGQINLLDGFLEKFTVDQKGYDYKFIKREKYGT